MEENVTNEPEETIHDKKLNRKVDRSLLVALVAVVISLIGTFVSVYEANVLREQQDLLAEQKSAAAWPFMKCTPLVNYNNDTTAVIIYEIANKGIGPAILGDVRYLFDGQDFESYSIDDGIIAKYDSFLVVQGTQNMQIDSSVIQPSGGLAVFTIQLTARAPEYVKLFNKVANELSVQFCYCSVYGDCWYRGSYRAPEKREECQGYINY